MFMHIAVVLVARQALTVPEEAIVVDASQTYVFVVVPKGEALIAERRDVTIGQRAFGDVEIVAGLAAGEDVITRGVQKASAGKPVRKAGQGGPGKGPGKGSAPAPQGAAG